MLEGGGRVRHDGLAGADFPGEGDLADLRVARQQPAGIRAALHHLKHAVRQPGLGQDLTQPDSRERRELRRLEDHCIAARERGRSLPTGDLQRIVPRADAGNDAERLAPRVAERLGSEVHMLAAEARRESGVVFEAFGAGDDIDGSRLLDGLARVAGLELGELAVAGAQQIGGAAQDAAALRPRHGGPLDLRRLRLHDRGINLHRPVHLEFGQHLTGRRIERRESVHVAGSA